MLNIFLCFPSTRQQKREHCLATYIFRGKGVKDAAKSIPISIHATQRRVGRHSTFWYSVILQNDSRRDRPETIKHRNWRWTVSWTSVRRLSLKGNAAEMRNMRKYTYLMNSASYCLICLRVNSWNSANTECPPARKCGLTSLPPSRASLMACLRDRIELSSGMAAGLLFHYTPNAKTTFKRCQWNDRRCTLKPVSATVKILNGVCLFLKWVGMKFGGAKCKLMFLFRQKAIFMNTKVKKLVWK